MIDRSSYSRTRGIFARISFVLLALVLSLSVPGVTHARAIVLPGSQLASSSPSAAEPPTTPCAAQIADAKELETEITAHNDKPHTFTQQQKPQAQAYDAEAAQLRSRQSSVENELAQCATAVQELEGASSSTAGIKPATPRAIEKITQGKAASQRYSNSPQKPIPGWSIPRGSQMRPLYDAIESAIGYNISHMGNVTLQGSPRPSIGDPDSAYPASTGYTIGTNARGQSNVSPDYIVPVTEFIQMPGFIDLTPDNMYLVAMTPINLQWLSRKANTAKKSRSAAMITGASDRWVADQLILEVNTRTKLQQLINELLRSQGSLG